MIELIELSVLPIKKKIEKQMWAERKWGVKYFPVEQGCPAGWKSIGYGGTRMHPKVKCIPLGKFRRHLSFGDDIEISGLNDGAEAVPPQVVTAAAQAAPSIFKEAGRFFKRIIRRKKKKAPAPTPTPAPTQAPTPVSETGITKYLPYIGIGVVGLLALGFIASKSMGKYEEINCPCGEV